VTPDPAIVASDAVDAPPDLIDTDAIDRASPIAALRLLIDEAKATLDSEVALAKTIGTIAGVSLQRMAMWGTVALLFAFVGLLALAVGMVIALAVVTGPLAAALIVGGLLFAIGLFAGLRARGYAITLRNAARMVVE
jgi:Putative Actinobacterial Holin-X, holin superfamily III